MVTLPTAHSQHSLVCQHYPQGSAPKARAAGNETSAPQLFLTKHLALDISSSPDSPAAPGEAPVLLRLVLGKALH